MSPPASRTSRAEALAEWQARAPAAFPPPWASAWGDDAFGLWADLQVKQGSSTEEQRMRWLEPGWFVMGSPDHEEGRGGNEGPQHQVTLTQGLWLADTACTQALWQLIMDGNPSNFSERNRGRPQHPVENVSWRQVQAFLERLQAQLPGGRASLPTEAEWEYACRAGTTTRYSFGDTLDMMQANYNGKGSDDGPKRGDARPSTVPVKLLPANAWGLYQMHGNVWEWCADAPRRYGRPAQVNPGLDEALAPGLADEDGPRAVRGCSWIDGAREARSAQRFQWQSADSGSYLGFRLALRP